MLCDMCGRESNLFKTKIDVTILSVCKSCSTHGQVLGSVESSTYSIQGSKFIPPKSEPEELISSNYSEIIRKKREQLNLTHKEFANLLNEKISLIHKIETGSIGLSLSLAKKLEKTLHVSLIEEFNPSETKTEISKKQSFTIGDMIKIKNDTKRN
jgi:putative transcription factor